MQSIRALTTLCLLFAISTVGAFEEPENWARLLFNEFSSGRPLPLISAIDPSLDLNRAYAIQRVFTRLRSAGDQISGYRAGHTGVPPSQQYKLREPILGALFSTSSVAAGGTIELAEHPASVIECQIGFVIDQAITQQLDPDTDLGALIREVRPVVELPRLYFAAAAGVTVPDLVAANGSGGLYIVGEPLRARDPETVNALFVELRYGGEIIDRGRATNVMGDQYAALRWMINALLARGQRIEAGQMLLTGALGDSIPAESGRYRAEFRDAAAIEFTIRDDARPVAHAPGS